MATEIWINFGSGNGLLPDGTKPLAEPMICRETMQATSVFRIMRETNWDVEQTRNRLPFLAKTTVQT